MNAILKFIPKSPELFIVRIKAERKTIGALALIVWGLHFS
jgi:hypothetical protein